jgi:hypothetical protein
VKNLKLTMCCIWVTHGVAVDDRLCLILNKRWTLPTIVGNAAHHTCCKNRRLTVNQIVLLWSKEMVGPCPSRTRFCNREKYVRPNFFSSKFGDGGMITPKEPNALGRHPFNVITEEIYD